MSSKWRLVQFTALLCAVVLGAGPVWSDQAAAQTTPSPAPTPASTDASANLDQAPAPLSEDEMEILVARIALYPDELVALISAASLYPLQIVEAARYLQDVKSNPKLKPKDSWDGSVVSLLNYPDVVKMMSDDLDWTQQLGSAIAYQQKDVLVAIQQLRDKAVADGVIKSDDKITVTNDNNNILIQPAKEDTVYVPKYEPQMLYDPGYQPAPVTYYPNPYPQYYYPTATYFAGFVTGAVFGAAVDWNDWGVWGGRWGGNVDIDCNNCLNNRNFSGKININDVDWKNVDRSKIKFDKNQFANLNRNNFGNSITSDRRNNIGNKAANLRDNRISAIGGQNQDIRDVRKSTLQGLKSGPSSRERRASVQSRPSGQAALKNRSGAPRMAARPDNRPSRPSGLGQVRSGKTAQLQSQRGHRSMGGGTRGGGARQVHRSGGGGARQIHREGGGGRRHR